MKSIGLVQSSSSVTHVSRYALLSLERAIAAHGVPSFRPPARGRMSGRLVKLLNKAGGLRSLRRKHGRALLIPMMGLQEGMLFPWTYSTEVIPIVFDCMPHQFDAWSTLFRRNSIDMAFFTSSMVADYFRGTMPGGTWLWLPEAVDIGNYSALVPWAERSIDVLEFGRRYARYHDAISEALARTGRSHVYEVRRGQLIFPSREDFIQGLASSRISVCFPQSQTHPERFGHIETLTQRYLESMASGSVILGAAPAELRRLFGYDPVIPVDWDDPVQQVLHLLQEPQQHAELRLRNLEAVQAHGCWERRALEVLDTLAELGYGLGSGDARFAATPPSAAS